MTGGRIFKQVSFNSKIKGCFVARIPLLTPMFPFVKLVLITIRLLKWNRPLFPKFLFLLPRFNAQGIVRGWFDEYKHGGVRRMSLAEWASLRGNLSCGPLLRGHSIFARLDCSLKELSKFIRKYLGKMLNAFGTILGLLLLPLSGGETRYNVG